jgi:hypothetical protein
MAERVVYVDSVGKRHNAQLLAEGERSTLLVSFDGAARLTTMTARYSADGEPGTWHRPPKPS